MISFHSNTKQLFDTVCIPYFCGKDQVDSIVEIFSEYTALALASGDFKAKEGELLVVYPQDKKIKRLILLGLGKKEAIDTERLRRAYSLVSKYLIDKNVESLSLIIPKNFEKEYQLAIVEGITFSNYRYDANQKEKSTLIKKIGLLGFLESLKVDFEEIEIIKQGVFLARQLVSGNADEVTPSYLANLAKDFKKNFKEKLSIHILGKKEIVQEGLGLLYAVSRGSINEPRFIVMEYKGDPKNSEKTVLIGKGITYDTGGLLIKPRGGMEDMRSDMAGAAACFGTIWSAIKLNLKINLSVIVASCENSIGPDAFKPGDVYISYSGKTVEVADTDAEGRLVLADAITYANKHLKPSRIIDLATLTGAMVVSLGEEMAGMFCNDKKLSDLIEAAGRKTHERVWPLPLNNDYKIQLKSDVADIKNKGDRYGGAITAALFLEDFVDKTPWAHLDIAGPAFYSKDRYYIPKNGTGFGVRLLIEYLKGVCGVQKIKAKK